MEISQLLPASGTSPAPKAPRGAAAEDGEFARMLKQSGEAADGKTASGATVAKSPSSDAPAETAVANAERDDPAALAADDSGVHTPETATEPAGLSPLSQNINQAMAAQLTSQPTQPPVINDSQQAVLQAAQATLGAGEVLDLNAIRERLTTIANAQRGEPLASQAVAGALAMPNAATLQDAGRNAADALKAASAALPTGSPTAATVSHGQAGTTGDQGENAGSRQQQLAAMSQQPIAASGNPTPASNGQPATFMDAVAANPVAGDAILATRGGLESHTGPTPGLGINLNTATSSISGQSQPSAVPSTPVLNAPLASAQWQQGLGQQLVSLHQRGGQQMELHLRPAELGPLTISLKVDDQLAQAQFFSANPQVRAAIEQAIPQLREALEESGIQLGEAMVGEHRQHNDGEDHDQDDAALASRAVDAQGTSLEESDSAATSSRTLSDNGNAVDLYA